jgi:hypothetical protein
MNMRRPRREIALVVLVTCAALVACTGGSSLGTADAGPGGGGCDGETFAPCNPQPIDAGKDASDAALLLKDSGLDAHIPSSECTGGPKPLVVTQACGSGMASSYDAPQTCTRELHVIGVYEASSNHTGPAPSKVDVDLPGRGPVVLALSGYEAVSWTVTATSGTTLEAIVLTGGKQQTVVAPSGVRVNDYSGPTGSIRTYAYAYPSAAGGSDTAAHLAALEATTGLPPTSFHGCYQGTAFTLK